MWELDYKESWVQNWCLWTVMLEKTLESPLDCKDIKPVNPKENQSWILIGRTDAEAETPTLWPPDAKNWLIGKDPDAGKDQRQKEKRVAEDEMVVWYHWFNGHELVSKFWELVMNREAWHAIVHGVTKNWTWLSHWPEVPETEIKVYIMLFTLTGFLHVLLSQFTDEDFEDCSNIALISSYCSRN